MPVAGTVVLLRDREGGGVETLLMRRPDRGSFAGAWVFPGGVVEDGDLSDGTIDVREADGADPRAQEQRIAAHAAVRECGEEVGLPPTDLVTLSCWMPPVEAPKRVRTWFFLAHAPEGELHPAAAEVIDARWMPPAEALQRHAAGELRLFPPTWVTLRGLADARNVTDALATASAPDLFATWILAEGVFVWGGDSEHPEGGQGRHRLETAVLPWTYLRD